MPYTPAHIILAAPIWYGSRQRLPLPALAIGCIAPDFPYFIHLTPVRAVGHTIAGLATHAVPQGLVALGVWYLWLEKPILALFALRPSPRRVSLGWCSLVLLSLFLGAATHALLDATSHESGWFVRQFAWLSYPIGSLPIFKWIQYGGGALGLGATLWWYLRARTIASVTGPSQRSLLTGIVVLAVSTLGFAGAANWIHQSHDLQTFAVHSAAGAMSGFVCGACFYAAIARVWAERKV